MNINKFTQKSIEAVNQCEKIAYDHGHQEIDQEHFLYSLLTIDDSLIASLLEKMGINKETFLSQVQELLNKKPKVSGGQVYMSNDLNQVLLHGEDEMKAMKDVLTELQEIVSYRCYHRSVVDRKSQVTIQKRHTTVLKNTYMIL